ncbi:MAG: DUF3501 family protein [Acidiferrobacterales bacterium]
MNRLKREDLYTLEEYAQMRSQFRARVMEHKKHRQVQVGPHARLFFEDRLTMHYQVQEMLRAERIFERDGIDGELDAYNPLIPDGTNWKATLMIEYEDAQERRQNLTRMVGIEGRVWVKVDGFEQVWAIADEDLERDTADKTSSVHFLRFELTRPMVQAVKDGAVISIGVNHEVYEHKVDQVAQPVRESLAQDLA